MRGQKLNTDAVIKSRALFAVVASFSLLFVSSVPSAITPRASAATSIYGETYATLGSFSGHAGPVAVSGGGYEPGTQVAVFTGEGAVPADAPKATVGADNSFGPIDVNIPVGTPQGAVTISVAGVGGLTDGLRATNSYYVTPFTAVITVTAAAHTPGSGVVISGSGFAPNETVALELATASSTVVADATGAFTGGALTVPNVPAASFELTGTGQSSGAVAVDYFYIDAFYPSASPSAYYLLPGQTLSFNGNGYKPGETVNITEGPGTPVSSFVVPPSATFEEAGGFAIPLDWASTSRELTLTGAESSGTSVLTVSIGGFFPSATPSAYYAMPGDSVDFSGAGFAPGETVNLFVGEATTAAKTFVVDATGAYEAAGGYTIPYGTTSSLNFRLVGQLSKAETTAGISIGQLFPQISPSEYYVHPGAPLTVTGTGFAKGETVNLAATGVTGSGVVDAEGALSIGPVTVPFGATESLTLTATGATSGGVATVTITIGPYTPTASASTYYLLPGNPVVISGTGFAPGEVIDVVQGTTVLASTPADTAGAVISAPIVVPFDANGPISYGLKGQSSGALAEVTITAGEYNATISSDNYYVRPGVPFNVTGGGFAPGETVTVTLGDTTETATADEFGTTNAVALTLPFPQVSEDKPTETSFTVTFIGDKSKAKAETNITPAPFYANVSPSTWYDQSGKPVSFSGEGFANGESVAVTLNGVPAGTALVGALGTFELTGLTLPYGIDAANYAFKGSQSGATASVTIGLAPYSPNVSPSTWYGKPGSAITFTGDGFAPGETVTAKLGTTSLGTATVDADGAFTFDGGTLPFSGPALYSFTGSLTASVSTVEVGISGFYAGLQLSSYYGPGGTAVVVEGSGFAPGENVAVTFGTTAVGPVATDTDGAFSVRTTAPFAPAGQVTVEAVGASSGATASTSFTYAQVYNSVELASYAVAPGEAVNVIGTGYFAGEPVQLIIGGSVVDTFVASATGNLTGSYVLPVSTTPGPLTLTIRGTQSFTEAEITIYVTGA